MKNKNFGFIQHHFPRFPIQIKNDRRHFLHRKNGAGFTLIELLVVIAVIGLLASIVSVATNSARAKARDAKRRGDLRQLVTALALYYDANSGAYPSTGESGNWYGNCATFGSHGTTGATGWIPNLAPAYLLALPLDPKPIPPTWCYLYTSNGIDYKILAYETVESLSSVPATDAMSDPAGRDRSFAVYTVGAASW